MYIPTYHNISQEYTRDWKTGYLGNDRQIICVCELELQTLPMISGFYQGTLGEI